MEAGIAYHIVSKKDNNMLTFIVSEDVHVNIKMSSKMKPPERRRNETKQSFVGIPEPVVNTFRIQVFETDSDGERIQNSKFLDFNPHDQSEFLFARRECSGQSQVWNLEEHENKKGVYFIKSCNGKFLKNKGNGKPVLVASLQPKDRSRKKFQWLLHAEF